MSRIGKKPIKIPEGVTARLDLQTVSVKGSKGEMQFIAPEDVGIVIEENLIKVSPRFPTKRARSMWGMSRSTIQNILSGVSSGFEKKLEITGVGYKASVVGKNLQLSLGYSHDILYPIPEGISIATTKPTEIIISGINKDLIGQIAAEIRKYRPPEPYKGKGVKYAGEKIFRKVGKKK